MSREKLPSGSVLVHAMNATSSCSTVPLPESVATTGAGVAVADTAPRANAKKKRTKKVAMEMPEGVSWPWMETLGMTEYESKEQRLHDEIVAYVAYISPTVQEIYARSQVMARIGDVVRRRFPRATMETFGSTALNLYLPDGDIDLAMNLPDEMDHAVKVKTLFVLAGALKYSQITHHTNVTRNARVPVVSFETTPERGSYKCDISINSTGSVKSVSVIARYLDTMPAFRYIVLVIKGYLSRIHLGSAALSGLSSYGIILLVTSFLQRNPKNLPVDDITKPLERESLGRLLMGFLEHYGFDFDYATSVVSVSTGGLLTKASKGWAAENQPNEMLAIEDPLNSDNDVGKSASMIKRVRTAFCEAHKGLQSYPLSMAQTNALGTILGMSPEAIARREMIHKIVDSGSLDRALQEVIIPPEGNVPRRSRNPQPTNGYAPYPTRQYDYNPYYGGYGYGQGYYGAPPAQQSSYGYDEYDYGYGGHGRAYGGHSVTRGHGRSNGRAGRGKPQ